MLVDLCGTLELVKVHPLRGIVLSNQRAFHSLPLQLTYMTQSLGQFTAQALLQYQ